MLLTRRRRLAGSVLIVVAAVSACTTPSAPDRQTGQDRTAMVLADGYEPETLNPLLGFGEEGASKLFDGLVEHRADRSVRAALAAEVPQPSPDGTTWTVKLRPGVKFHDGTTFGSEDVVATYRAVLDPAFASTVRSNYSMVTAVDSDGPTTVRFTLAYPYAPFVHRMVLGIVPSESVAQPGPLERSPLNAKPVGTGPYKLTEWRRGDRMVMEANDDYFLGAPKVRKLTVVFAIDDNTRAQRMRAGEFDGTALPPLAANGMTDVKGAQVIKHSSADYRTVVMPMNNPVTGDRAMRLALNYAMNRGGMIQALLGGKGQPASTPIPQALPEFVEPTAQFRYDKEEAARLLEQAGWVLGADGVRARGPQRASFSLMYPAGDSVRKDLAQAFASDAKAVGVEVKLEGLGWEAIEPRMGADALVLGGGNPFDPDLKSYPLLHSSFAANGFNNPGSYRNAQVDAALDAGRKETDPAQRVAYYRQFQRAYAADPAMVFLVFLDHTYVVRDGWTGYQEVVDPHTHGLTWGPWWNVQSWVPKG
ncbi:ABC transporter substrate-binding protein [Allokutzneria multivorans]|uniref:ABC transporter substrate-binding protein n=1 Tax=Allokutzneria multivorans TaxID=1142134 RepID=A0ABP7TGA5_9PSEU